MHEYLVAYLTIIIPVGRTTTNQKITGSDQNCKTSIAPCPNENEIRESSPRSTVVGVCFIPFPK